jgi:hypothetical protein
MFLGLAIHLALAGALLFTRKAWRRWPVLFALSLFEICLTLLLLNMTGDARYKYYFYTYWIAECLRSFIALGLLFEILRYIPGIRFAPKNLRALCVGIAVAMAIGSAWMASDGGAHTFHATMLALALDRSIYVAWGAFAIVLLYGTWISGLGWTATPLRLATGFLVFTLVSALDAYGMSAAPASASTIHTTAEFLELSVWAYWSMSILMESKNAPQSTETLRDLFRIVSFQLQTAHCERTRE